MTMRNRKAIITAFVLVAIMLMAVGYAAVTNVLDIQGSASVSLDIANEEFNKDIYFVGVIDDTNAAVDSITDVAKYGYTANINTNNNDKAQFTVNTLKNAGDKVIITYQIKNESAYEATVSLKTITNSNGSTQANGADGDFDFDFYFGTPGTKTATIAANGGTTNVSVVITLNNQLTEAATAAFTIELNATAG